MESLFWGGDGGVSVARDLWSSGGGRLCGQ